MEKTKFINKNTISAIVLIGGNMDKVLLKKCLDSINWCDEIIKVDTLKVPGSFADWRNYGAEKAKNKWLLYIDSDEEVGADLAKEIRIKIHFSSYSAYVIPRRNIFLGKEMKFGGWTNDYVLRLIKKESLVNWVGSLHEQPIIEGKVGKMENKLVHRTHRSIFDMVAKTNEWSGIEASLMLKAAHPSMNLVRFTTAGFREFWHRGIKKLGFLDGSVGVLEIIYQVYSRLISYIKLWEMQEARKTL